MTQPASKRLVSEARLSDITTAATNAGIASAQSQINASAAAAASSATAAQNSANLVGAPAGTAIDTYMAGKYDYVYSGVAALLAAPAMPSGANITLRSFSQYGDGVRPQYIVSDVVPTGLIAKASVPLAGGKWAIPSGLPMHPGYRHHPREYISLVQCAKTYVANKSLFLWDPSREPAVTSTVNINGTNMPITCSSFTGIVYSGIDFNDSLYAPGTTQNTVSRKWGINFSRRTGVPNAFQAHRHAQYFFENGMLFQAAEDLSNIRPGDILFFSKQQPEGPGTENYFLNIYHVALLLNYGGPNYLVHSKSASDPSGIMEDAFTSLPSLTSDIVFFARPRLPRVSVSKKTTNVTVGGFDLSLTSAGASLVSRIADDMVTIHFNGATFAQAITGGALKLTTLGADFLPDGDVASTLLTTVSGKVLRARVATDGSLTLYSESSVAAGTIIYGSLTYPRAVGHVALGMDLPV